MHADNPSDRSPRLSAHPSLRQVKAFLAVADHGSVSRAAGKLYRAQSAVTRLVLDLEAAVGVPLFERRPAGMRTTVFGEAFERRARRAALEFDHARREVTEIAGRRVHPTAPVFSMQVGERRLAALIALTESHHMPAVAEKLGVTQPAVSAALRELEDGLGIPLFERTPRGLIPSDAALVLARRARLALNELSLALEEIAALQGIMQGRVRVGALPLGRTAILPRAVARLLESHPAIHVSVIEGPFDTLAVALRSGELDFIFGALREFPYGSDLAGNALLEDRLSIVVRSGHPLTRRRGLTLADLGSRKWVLNRESTPARTLLDRAFSAQGLAPPQDVVETASLAMTRGLLIEGDFLTALSRHQIEHELRFGMLAILPIELPQTVRRIGIMQRRDSAPSPAASLLGEEIRVAVNAITAAATGPARKQRRR